MEPNKAYQQKATAQRWIGREKRHRMPGARRSRDAAAAPMSKAPEVFPGGFAFVATGVLAPGQRFSDIRPLMMQ